MIPTALPRPGAKSTGCPQTRDTLPGPQWGLGLPSLSCREQQGPDHSVETPSLTLERKESFSLALGRQAFCSPTLHAP